MRGDVTDTLFHPIPVQFDQGYDFAVPRLGFTWTPRASLNTFVAWSHTGREPAFRDLYDAEGPGNVPLYRGAPFGIYDVPLIRPEHVNDYEVGADWRGRGAALGANLFRMDFRDELVYAGQFDADLGYPILGNAARSVHQGIELSARLERALGGEARVALDANTTLSDNHFVRYREIYGPSAGDTVTYDGKAIGFFPAALGNLSARLAWRGATLGAETQLVGRMYLDNTEDKAGSIAPHAVLNLSGGYRLARAQGAAVALAVRVFNALDTRYETGGYSYLDLGTRYTDFIPAATRNALAEVKVEF
jgi:iron complex outermembrane receptor protein